MKYRLIAASLGLALTAGAAPALAHHSFAMFDRNKRLELKGTVKEFQWTNPHVFVQLMVPNAAGVAEEWSIEGGSPNMLFRQGLDNHAFKPGDHVLVLVNPLRSGAKGGSLVYGELASGKTVGNKTGVGGPS